MELLPLVCLCLLSWSGTTSADHHERVVVKQDDDAVLNCSFNGVNIETGVFDWKRDKDQNNVFLYAAGKHFNNGRDGQAEQFKGRVFHFQDELKHGNASIKIKRTKMTDSGDYTCIFPNLQPPQSFHIKLVVEPVLKDRTGENIPGAAPKPSITTMDETDDSALLQCEAHGVPDLEVHWQDRAGNKLTAEEPQVSERGGLVYITLNTTVTKTGRFYCVATQKKISHRIFAETYVRLTGAASRPYITTVKTEDGLLLQCEVHGVSPKPKVEWKDSSGNILPAEEPQVKERGGSYDIILRAPVTKNDNFRCVVTQEENNHRIYAETYAHISGSDSVSPLNGLLLLQFLLLFFLF